MEDMSIGGCMDMCGGSCMDIHLVRAVQHNTTWKCHHRSATLKHPLRQGFWRSQGGISDWRHIYIAGGTGTRCTQQATSGTQSKQHPEHFASVLGALGTHSSCNTLLHHPEQRNATTEALSGGAQES